MDVIKTRYMSDHTGVYKTPFSCILATYREAGVVGFFKVSPTLRTGCLQLPLYVSLSCSHHTSSFRLILTFILPID